MSQQWTRSLNAIIKGKKKQIFGSFLKMKFYIHFTMLHTLSNCIDGAWIDSWLGKLDVTVIDAIMFHLPISTKFKSFQMLSTSFLNHIV